MKKTITTGCLVICAAVISLFNSCSKSPITFNIPITATVSYGPANGSSGTTYATTLQTSTLDSFIKSYGGVPADLQTIDLKSLTVILNSPAARYFNDFNGITAYIRDSSDSTKFAFLAPVPQNTDTANFSSQFVDMSTYFNASSFSIDIVGTWENNSIGIPQETVTVNMIVAVTIKGH